MNRKNQTHCPLCNSAELMPFLNCHDHLLTNETFKLVKCPSCGFVFTQDPPHSEEIGKYYQSQDYVSHSDTRKGIMNKVYHAARNFMLGQKFSMVRKTTKGNNLLDIGTGTGYFPGYMKKKGFNVFGVEIDPKAREAASNKFGFNVYSPAEFLAGGVPGKFDIITLWHVLEHLDDFDLYLKKMLEQLEKDGTLVIALPNCSAFDARFYKEFWAGYDVPRHLWHFTPSTLKLVAEKHGLTVKKMKRLPLDPFYNAMLSEKYRGNKLYMFAGLIIGKLAYLESLLSLKKSSSVVYFLQRDSARL